MDEFKPINNQLAELQKELQRLSTATDQIDKAKEATQTVIEACQSLQDNLRQVVELTDRTTQRTQETMQVIQDKVSYAIETVQNDTLDKSQKGLKAIEAVREEIHKVLDTISRVDFPSRLDKLDNSVSATYIGLQNLTTVCNDLSKKNEDLVALCGNLSQKSAELESKLSSQQKWMTRGFIVLFVIIVVQTVFQILL